MKQTILLLIAILLALGSSLSAAEPTIKKPFNGTNFDGWTFRTSNNDNCWTIANITADAAAIENLPAMVNLTGADWNKANPRKGVDIITNEKFGDCTIKLELLIPKGSNSGIYLMGRYEVQVADSFGKSDDRLGQGDMGAIYSAAKPSTNACAAPGTWQKFEIEFVAPKFDAAGNKTANGLFKKITLNGKVIQENVQVEKPTGGEIDTKEAATGPLMLQGDHGPVAFRNIEIIVP